MFAAGPLPKLAVQADPPDTRKSSMVTVPVGRTDPAGAATCTETVGAMPKVDGFGELESVTLLTDDFAATPALQTLISKAASISAHALIQMIQALATALRCAPFEHEIANMFSPFLIGGGDLTITLTLQNEELRANQTSFAKKNFSRNAAHADRERYWD